MKLLIGGFQWRRIPLLCEEGNGLDRKLIWTEAWRRIRQSPKKRRGYDDESHTNDSALDCFSGLVLSVFTERVHGCGAVAAERKGCVCQRSGAGGSPGAVSSPEQQHRGDCLYQQQRRIFISRLVRFVCRFSCGHDRPSGFRAGQARGCDAFCRENIASRFQLATPSAVDRGRDSVGNCGCSAWAACADTVFYSA